MALKTLQVNQTGTLVPVSASPIKCKWAMFQNNASSAMRVGDLNTTTTRGYSLAASGGNFPVPYPIDLSQWYTIGANAQSLDVIYDDIS